MRALADAGRTVLIASHLLGEIEQIADSVSIMGRGRVIAAGDLEEFLNDGSEYVAVEIDDVPAAFETLQQRTLVTERERNEHHRFQGFAKRGQAFLILQRLLQ